MLLGNKCDQPASGAAASTAALEAFSKEKGFAGWFNISAKENTNVEEAAKFLIEKVAKLFFEETTEKRPLVFFLQVIQNEKWRRHAGDARNGGGGYGVGGARVGGTREEDNSSARGPRILVLDQEAFGNSRRRDCNC